MTAIPAIPAIQYLICTASMCLWLSVYVGQKVWQSVLFAGSSVDLRHHGVQGHEGIVLPLCHKKLSSTDGSRDSLHQPQDAMLSTAVTIVIKTDPELSLQRCFGPGRRHLENQNYFLNDCHGNEEGCMMFDAVAICHCKSLVCHFMPCSCIFAAVERSEIWQEAGSGQSHLNPQTRDTKSAKQASGQQKQQNYALGWTALVGRCQK